MKSKVQHSHTHLYIVVILLVIFALLFFSYKVAPSFNWQDKPLELQRVELSDEERSGKQAFLGDPALREKTTLTASESAAKEKLLQDPLLTQKKL